MISKEKAFDRIVNAFDFGLDDKTFACVAGKIINNQRSDEVGSFTTEESNDTPLVRLYKIHSMILLLEECGDRTMSYFLPRIRNKMMNLEMEQ